MGQILFDISNAKAEARQSSRRGSHNRILYSVVRCDQLSLTNGQWIDPKAVHGDLIMFTAFETTHLTDMLQDLL